MQQVQQQQQQQPLSLLLTASKLAQGQDRRCRRNMVQHGTATWHNMTSQHGATRHRNMAQHRTATWHRNVLRVACR
jgi:hypothetical protein